MVRTLVAALAVASITSTSSHAGADPASSAAPLQPLVACRSLDDAARLACYDRAVASLDEAQRSGGVIVVDRAEVRKAEREAFGFNLPSLRLFDRSVGAQELTSLTLTAARVSRGSDGAWTFVTEDGQIWRQTDARAIVPRPKPGSKIEVEKGALGAFFLSVDGDKAVRAKRVQ